MPEKLLLTLIWPEAEATSQSHRTLRSLLPVADKIQMIFLRPWPHQPRFPNSLVLTGDPPQTLAHLINRSLSVAGGEFLTMLQPGIEVSADLPTRLAQFADRHPDADYFYGDYVAIDSSGSRGSIESNCCPDDITEREDWGPLEIYRTSALHRMGGCDERIRFRTDYDLRLKLTDTQPAAHLPHALCAVAQRQPEQAETAQALFFPGRGKFGGFSYLFMDAAEEQEVEEIFYDALRRRGAYLEQAPGGMFPAPEHTRPRVSVIIPVHNRGAFLSLAVASIQRGEFPDFEVIIIDNASTDDTLTVAQSLARSDSRIRFISLPDNIIARALNAGVKAARGEYIAQLDSDDEYTAATLDVMVRHLDEHPDEGLAISYYELMNESGETLEEFGVIKHLEYNRNNILRVDGAGAVRVWRKAAILEFGGFNEEDFGHYGEDYDLVLKVGERYEVGRVHQVLYRYRRHPGNSDILRPQALKIRNKTLARQRAIQRRRTLNQRRLR